MCRLSVNQLKMLLKPTLKKCGKRDQEITWIRILNTVLFETYKR